MPSYGGSNGPDGSKKSGDQGQGSRDKDGGNTGGGKSGDSKGSGFGGSGKGKSKGTGSGSSSKTGNYSDARDDPVAKEQNARNADARNDGESWGDGIEGFANEIAHMVGGLLGLDEEEQDFTTVANDMARPEYNGPPAGTPDNMRGHWSYDPMQTLADFAGLATGLPVGTIYGLGKNAWESATGIPLGTEIDLGRSVLDREDSPTNGPAGNPSKPTKDNVSSGETKTAGLQNDKGPKGNGLLGKAPVTSAPPKKPATSPTTPTNPTTPENPAGQPGGYPKPGERFTAPTYYAGNWVRDPATQEVKWKPHAEGLLA
jgi:hypothetical protein